MTAIPFTKMQATGNDFVLIDNRTLRFATSDFAELARQVSDRKFGIGSDGLILLDDRGENRLIMHYKNPDGSDAGMCGNGARCFVRFARELGYEGTIHFRVHDNIYSGEQTDGGVTIHFPLETSVNPVEVDGETVFQVYTNTEHIVFRTDSGLLEDESALFKKGRTLRHHKMFSPTGTNVNFMSGMTGDELKLQTYERGVENLTLACGTGAIASALAWHYENSGQDGHFSTTIHVSGGRLKVFFSYHSSRQTYNEIKLSGPASTVFEGLFNY